MLTLPARTTFKPDSESSANHGRQSTYLLPAVTGAMYLLLSSTAHDLRAGFSMLVDGRCPGQRSFGFGLLVVYGIMITVAMTVLASTSEDSASVLLNAVAVLFIADLVNKTRNDMINCIYILETQVFVSTPLLYAFVTLFNTVYMLPVRLCMWHETSVNMPLVSTFLFMARCSVV